MKHNLDYFDYIYRESHTKYVTALLKKMLPILKRLLLLPIIIPFLLLKFLFVDCVLMLIYFLLDQLYVPILATLRLLYKIYEYFEPIIEFQNYWIDIIMAFRKRQSYWHFLNPINYTILLIVLMGLFLKLYITTMTLVFLYRFIIVHYRNKLKFEYECHYNVDKIDTRINIDVLYQRYLIFGRVV